MQLCQQSVCLWEGGDLKGVTLGKNISWKRHKSEACIGGSKGDRQGSDTGTCESTSVLPTWSTSSTPPIHPLPVLFFQCCTNLCRSGGRYPTLLPGVAMHLAATRGYFITLELCSTVIKPSMSLPNPWQDWTRSHLGKCLIKFTNN